MSLPSKCWACGAIGGIRTDYDDGYDYYRLECGSCGNTSQWFGTFDEAVKDWEARVEKEPNRVECTVCGTMYEVGWRCRACYDRFRRERMMLEAMACGAASHARYSPMENCAKESEKMYGVATSWKARACVNCKHRYKRPDDIRQVADASAPNFVSTIEAIHSPRCRSENGPIVMDDGICGWWEEK